MGRASSGTPHRRGRLYGRRLSTRLLLSFGLVAGLIPFTATPASAAAAATASVDQKISYRAQTSTYTFTVTNTSTAGERIASVQITRPSSVHWSLSGCPTPPAGWTTTLTAADHCTFNSGAGPGDDIAAGSSRTFSVSGGPIAGKTTEEGIFWSVVTDNTDTFNAGDGSVAATGAGNALVGSLYSASLTDVVVETTATPIGASCPTSNKKASAGSTRVLTLCGRVYANSDFNAKGLNSDATGSFVASAGTLLGANVPQGPGSVVLARFPTANITAVNASGLNITAYAGNAPEQMTTPVVTFTGYATDFTAPPAPSTPDLATSSDSGASSTDNITNDNTPTLVGTAEPNSTLEILIGGTVRATATTAADGSYSATFPGGNALGEGAHTLTARATDQAGNVGPESGTFTMTVDTGVPADPTIDQRPGTIGVDDSPTWGFSGEAGTTFTCTLVRPDLSQVVDNTCASPKTYDLTAGSDGTYGFRVRQTDVAGNQSGQNTDSYVLDRIAPADPTISARPAESTSNPAVSWTFSGEPGGTFECILDRPDATQHVDPNCTSPKSFDLTTRPDGLYTFKVRQTDTAGHQSGYTTDTFTLDRLAPVAPNITGEPPVRSNDETPQWNFSGEPGGTYECELTKPGGAQVNDGNCTSSKGYDLSADGDGVYTFRVRQLDAAGTPGPYASSSFTLDRQAPAAPSITARPANFTADEDPEWTFSGEFSASYECVLVRPDNTEVTAAPCGSPATFALASEVDGAYTFKVRQIDSAGNPGPYATDDFTLDRVTPSAPSIDVSPANEVNNPNVQWDFSGETNAVFECVLVKPDLTEVTDGSCSGPKAHDLSGEADGTYTFKVRQTDQAGHVSPYQVDSFTLDRQAPVAPTITDEPPVRANDVTPEWDFTGEAGGSFECELTKPGGAQVNDANCSGPKSYDLSSDVDGLYTFRVRQTDAAGNTGAFETSSFTLDRLAPSAPTITSRPANVTTDETPEWTFTGEFGASFECVLVRPDTTELNTIPCGSPATFALATEQDGAYTYKVRQIDSAGNPGPYATDNFTLDRLVPVAPSIDTRPANDTNNPNVQWSFSGESNAVFECVLVKPDLTEITDASCISSKAFDLSGEADGTYTFKVRQTDLAGLQGPFATDSFTLDRQAPVAPTVTAAPPARTNNPAVQWNFSGEAGGTYECVLTKPGGTQVTDGNCSGPKSYNVAGDADGLYTFRVRQTDAAANTGPYQTSTFTLDRQPPVAPTITGRPNDSTSSEDPQWTFTGEAAGSYECVLVRPDTSEVSTTCSSPASFPLSGETDGNYTFKVRQTDVAGNTGPFATDGFTLDRQVPVAPTITVQPPNLTNDDTPTWNFTGEVGGTYECVITKPGGAQVSDANCVGPKSYNFAGDGDGLYTFRVRQTDAAGNAGPFATDTYTLDRQAPVAPSITVQPPTRTNDDTPTWNFTGEAGGVYECVLTKPGGAQVTDAACSGPKSYSLSGDADGLYTFQVRHTDVAGNTGPYASSTYTLDRQAPAAPAITGRPANVTADQNPQWTFTGEVGATYECVLVRPGGTEIGPVSCTSPATFALALELDGDYTFKVRQTDVAGNTGVYATDNFTLDRVAPAAPAITARPAEVVGNAVVQWSFTGEANATFECVLVKPDSSQVTDASCISPKSLDLSGDADGVYSFRIRQTDQAGHTSPYVTDSFTLDREVPTPPTITSAPPVRTNDPTQAWAFTGEPGGTFQCELTKPLGAVVTDSNCVSAKNYNFTADVDGLYTFRVRQLDDASNPGPYATSTFTLDRVAPVAPVIGTRPSNSTNDPDPVWTFTGEFGASYECVLLRSDGTQVGAGACGSPAGFSLAAEPDGTYTFRVRQTDAAGNVGPYASDDFAIDRIAPDPPTITSRPSSNTNNPNVAWTFTGDGIPPFECILIWPGGSFVERQPCSTPDAWDLTAHPDGTYTFRVRQLDDAGNKSVYTSDTFTLDRVAPAAPTITSQPAVRTNDDTPTWGFSGEFVGNYQCILTKPGGAQVTDNNCASPKTYDVSGDVDGLYTFRVRQTDVAGNTGPYVTVTYTLDRQAPAAPSITSQPPSRTNDDTPTWGFVGEAGGAYECVLTKPGGVQVTDASCASPKTYDLTGDVDGLYTFRVRQTDVAGNTGPYTTVTYTLDRQAPVGPTITSEPPARTNDDTPTWNFTGEAGATFECVLTKPGGAQVTDANCSSPKNYNVSADADGLYTFRVRQTDVAGNTGPYTTVTYTLDRQAPVGPTITSEPPARTNDDTPTWNFTGEAGATFECVLTKPGGAQIIDAGCVGPKNYDVSGDADGLYTFRVRQTDVAGNTGAYTTVTYTLDRQAPVGPTITSEPPARTNDDTPQWNFTGEPTGTFECELTKPGGAVLTDASCSGPKGYDLTGDVDGLYTFKVRQTDVAGNTGPYTVVTYTLDRLAPVAPTITSQPPTRINDDTPTWNFTGEAGGTFECVLTKPGGAQVTDSNCVGPKGYDVSADADGLYTFRVRQTDVAGNTGAFVTVTYTLDRQAPVPPTVTSQPPAQTNDDTPTWNFTGEAGGTFECVLTKPGGAQVTDSNCAGPMGYNVSGDADGIYTFQVRQTDVAGNTGAFVTVTYELDRQPPVDPAITSRPANDTPDESPEWTFTGEPGATFVCVLVRADGSEVTTDPCTSPATFPLTFEQDGTYTFKVLQIDDAGNPGPYATDTFTLDRVPPGAPTIDSRPVEEAKNPVVEWTFSGEPTATFECILVRPNLTQISDTSCTSPKSMDLSGEVDGDYTFMVRQVDAAGLPGPYATDTFTLDRQAPAPPNITSQPPARTNDNTPEWTFTGEAGGTYDCSLVRSNNTEINVPCTSPKTFTMNTELDGDYTFKVRQTDDAGNVGPYATATFFLDRERPQAPMFTALPPNTTGSNTPRWTFTGEANAVFECVLTRPDLSLITVSPCSSPNTINLVGEPEGFYRYKVRQTDVAGNVSGYVNDTFTLDRSAPGNVAILSEPPPFTTNTSPVFEFEGEGGGTLECALVRPVGTQLSTQNCTSPMSYNLATDQDGTYTFKVRQTDGAFNRGDWATSTFTLDRVNPVAPVITGAPTDPTADDTPEWTFTGEAGASYECGLKSPDGSEVSLASCTSPTTFDVTDDEDGTYTFKVRQADGAGNLSPYVTDDFTLDTTPPAVPTFTENPPTDGSDPTVQWAFTREPGGHLECIFVKPGDVLVTDLDCTSPVAHDLTAEVDGTYTFMVRQLDDLGNASAYATWSYGFDRIAPIAPTITSTPQYFYDTTPEWGFTGENGGTYECVLVRPDGTEMVDGSCSNPGGFDLGGEPDGDYIFKVRQIDAAGNVGEWITDDHSFNKTPPTPVLGGGAPALTNDSTHETTIAGEPDAVFECTLVHPDGTESVVTGCTSPYAFDLSTSEDGDYTLSVRQFFGPNGSLPATQSFTLDRTAAKPAVDVDPGAFGNVTSPTWTFEGEQGAVFECMLVLADGTEVVDDDCQDPEQRSLDGQPDGDYVLKVRQTDPAGNVSLFAVQRYVLDREAPDAPEFKSTPTKYTRDLTPTWAFKGEGGATFDCELTTPKGDVRKDGSCSNPRTFNLEKVKGRYRLSVTQTDRAGNESEAVVNKMMLDLKKPVAKGLRVGPKRFVPSSQKKVTIRFRPSELASATVVIKKGAKTLKTFKKPLGKKAVTFRWRTVHRKKVIKPGSYTVFVRLKDRAGWKSQVKTRLRVQG